MSEATPRPWSVQSISIGNGYRVLSEPSLDVVAFTATKDNADLIVKAVNRYDDLSLIAAMRKARGLLAKGRTVGHEGKIRKLALEAENILIEALDALKEV